MSTGILYVCDWSVEYEENTAAVKTRGILCQTTHLETLVLADRFKDGTAPIHVAVRDLGTPQSKATVNLVKANILWKHDFSSKILKILEKSKENTKMQNRNY